MKKAIKIELWKATHNNMFILALIIGLLLVSGNVFQNYTRINYLLYSQLETFSLSNGTKWCYANFSHTSVYYNWLGAGALNFSNTMFYLIMPILAAMPCSTNTFCEKKSHYHYQIQVRIKKSHNLWAKYLSGYFIGGICVALPLAVDFLINALLLPATIPLPEDMAAGSMFETQFGSRLFYTHPNLFVLASILLVFFWGGTLCSLAMAAGTILHHKYLILTMPFIICMLFEMLYSTNFIKTETEWSPIQLFHMVSIRSTSGWVIIGEIGIFTLLSMLLFILRGLHDENL